MRKSLSLCLTLAAALAAPTVAQACGGFFCGAQTPVNQAAERILFAVDGDQTVMHVRVDYVGPPTDFGWILPVPRGVETALSSETLFSGLDAAFSPTFSLNYEFAPGCESARNVGVPEGDFAAGSADAGAAPPSDPSGVTVVSRENVGPYDRAILDAQTVAALREWLDTNQFAIPRDFDERLQPYIDAGAVFVVIKLLPGVDSGEIVPLKMTFPGNTPSVPIVPTAVAASPDLGVIVHVLGDRRAIPLNYRHVVINDATIDWTSGGANYADVVSQAADEAGGHAFTTDFAGSTQGIGFELPIVSDDALRSLEAVRDLQGLDRHLCDFGFDYRFLNDRDANRIFSGVEDVAAYLRVVGLCGFEFSGLENAAVDGAALAAKVRTEINGVRADLNELLARRSYMTRLYTTMSAVEMDRDPIFDFNADLEAVSNQHTATAYIECPDGVVDYGRYELRTANGQRVQVTPEVGNPMVVRRRDGMTVQQGAAPAAAVVQRLTTSGPAENVSEPLPPSPVSEGNGSGASGATPRGTRAPEADGCAARPAAGGAAWGFAALVGLAAVTRRRRLR
jgi:hypothetical protein